MDDLNINQKHRVVLYEPKSSSRIMFTESIELWQIIEDLEEKNLQLIQ